MYFFRKLLNEIASDYDILLVAEHVNCSRHFKFKRSNVNVTRPHKAWGRSAQN